MVKQAQNRIFWGGILLIGVSIFFSVPLLDVHAEEATSTPETETPIPPVDTPAATSTPATSTPPTTTSTTTPEIATTTPSTPTPAETQQHTPAPSQPIAPSAVFITPPVNQEYITTLNNILNEIIAPTSTPEDNDKPKEKHEKNDNKKIKNSSNIGTSTIPASITPTNNSRSTPAITSTTKNTSLSPLIARVPNERITDTGDYNYYVPLDNLSRETTYALSGIALFLGILGASFIIKDQQEDLVWTPPTLPTQEPLLEP